jgi:acetyl-CoA C-acetyltransferase
MSSPDPARIPVLVGVGQAIERKEQMTVIDLTERASLAAFEDAPGLSQRIERITTINVVFSPCGKAPSSELATRLGLADAYCESTTPGGNTPQWLITRAAGEIAAGKLSTTLIVGAEATRSMRNADPDADFIGANRPAEGAGVEPVVGPQMDNVLTMAEIKAQLVRPMAVYPIFDSALAASSGRSCEQQREFIGRMLAPFTRVAASNPFAWFRKELDAAEISDPLASNRLTAEPYTKKMNSFPNVDQGSALLVTSLELAREAGLADQCIFPWAGATNSDVTPASRRDLGDSPAIRAAATALFAGADLGIDDFDWIDLYSCFPSAVQVGAKAIGLSLDDSRGLTLTGGLPFFGGPGNNYSSHALASMAGRLRESGRLAYVACNGGFLSKHSLGIYGSGPPPNGFLGIDTSKQQEEIDAAAIPIVTEAAGEATVVGGTVVYGRDGAVESAPVIADLDDGRRVVAMADPSLLPSLAGMSLVGSRVSVAGSPPIYSSR